MAVILSTLQGKIILYMPGRIQWILDMIIKQYLSIRRTKLPNDAFKRCKCNTVMIIYIFCDRSNA